MSTKISSMGLFDATIANAIISRGSGSVTEIYAAPEVLSSGGASMQGDLFSFGMLMMEAVRYAYLCAKINLIRHM